MTSVFVASLLAVALAVDAAEPEPAATVPDPKWEGVYRRANWTANAGVVTNLVGVGLIAAGTGLALRNEKDVGSVGIRAGATLGLIGTPLAAGGSLRARKAVVHQGHTRPSAGWGVSTWVVLLPVAGLTGGAWLLTTPQVLGVLTQGGLTGYTWYLPMGSLVVAQAGGSAMARVQLARNRRARTELALVPTWSRRSSGLALSGTW